MTKLTAKGNPKQQDSLFYDSRQKNMRNINLIIFALIGLASCGDDRKNMNDAASIAFITTPVKSPSLLVTPALKCYPKTQRLELKLGLKSLVPEKLTINEIVLSNSNGLNSRDESITNKILTVQTDRDTTLQLTFHHINDKALFHATGLPGLIDSSYNLSVFYSVEGKEGVRVVNLVSRMAEGTFLSYKKSYNTPVQVYYFNTTNGFAERQRKFLTTNAITKTPPFVHVTDQEVAVSGLNFRIKCFHRGDSLHTELFAVNHSDMTIKIDTSKIDMIVDGLQSEISDAELTIEKVSGSKDEADILRKGDRSIIKMRKYVRNNPERMWLAFAESFFLSTGKPLFNDNLELIRSSDSRGSN